MRSYRSVGFAALAITPVIDVQSTDFGFAAVGITLWATTGGLPAWDFTGAVLGVALPEDIITGAPRSEVVRFKND